MNLFQKAIIDGPPSCDICGKTMIVLYGCGVDNDRIYCPDYRGCGAEIEYPTSTMPPELEGAE